MKHWYPGTILEYRRPMVDTTEIFYSKTKSEECKRKMTSLIVSSVVRRKDLSERTWDKGLRSRQGVTREIRAQIAEYEFKSKKSMPLFVRQNGGILRASVTMKVATCEDECSDRAIPFRRTLYINLRIGRSEGLKLQPD